MNKKTAELLNAQVNKELYSAYLYLGISKFFSRQNLPGFASWYKVQAEEEQEHAMKIYDYLLDEGEDVELSEIAAVKFIPKDALEAVKEANRHEHYITAEIEKIMDAAVKAKDYRTQLFLNWFITEQAEEEKNSGDMCAKVEILGNSAKDLWHLDRELSSRK